MTAEQIHMQHQHGAPRVDQAQPTRCNHQNTLQLGVIIIAVCVVLRVELSYGFVSKKLNIEEYHFHKLLRGPSSTAMHLVGLMIGSAQNADQSVYSHSAGCSFTRNFGLNRELNESDMIVAEFSPDNRSMGIFNPSIQYHDGKWHILARASNFTGCEMPTKLADGRASMATWCDASFAAGKLWNRVAYSTSDRHWGTTSNWTPNDLPCSILNASGVQNNWLGRCSTVCHAWCVVPW